MDRHFSAIRVSDLRDICRRNFRLVGREYSSRRRLYQALERQPMNILNIVIGETKNLIKSGATRYSRAQQDDERQGSRKDHENVCSKRRKLTDGAASVVPVDDIRGEAYVSEIEVTNDVSYTTLGPSHPPPTSLRRSVGDGFMVAPDRAYVDSLIAEFVDATGNEALKYYPCCSCARDTPKSSITAMKIDDLPNSFVLRPTTPHRSHDLTGGRLLYRKGILPDRVTAYVCNYCLSYLWRKEKPPLSLANDMWIGDIPYQLSNLTLPERLMIAKGFPSAYIVKLFPKQRGALNWEKSQFHNGLKGNVSTYKMNPAQLADVIINNDLPHPARILPATIGVTFVGPKGVKLTNLPDTLRVRRWRVRDALVWLKENNPLYADVNISQSRLDDLPVNAIPEELLSIVKYSADVETLDRERDGYVPEYDEEEDTEGKK